LLPPLLAALHLRALALLALLPPHRPRRPQHLRRFAVLAPAHNEERAIPELLTSLEALDYPRDLYTVTVIADNCDDRTATVARSMGARVVERADAATGKGYALAFGIERIDHDVDAVVFVDGDCSVSPNLLRAFNARLDSGERVVQAHFGMKRPSDAADVILRELALGLVHMVRPLARSRFGGTAGLKGSGMCFSRDALAAAPWRAFGLAEDAEQHVVLVRAGMRVAFAPEATVLGEAPARLKGAVAQHRRWEAGRLAAARRDGIPLLVEGFRRRSVPMLDAAIELLIPPVSLLAVALPLLAAGAFALGHAPAFAAALAGIAALALYLGAGAVRTRITFGEFVRALAALPVYVGWKLLLYARAAVSRPARWEKTERADAESAAAR
jgi:cellulose synthase/poly-beta-1,6-N-acetylglucosamine synthase-like glycosyltransferase